MVNMSILIMMAAKSCDMSPDKWLSFITHSKDTAGIIVRCFDRMPNHEKEYIASGIFPNNTYDVSLEKTRNLCRLAALLHDIGKLTPAFQRRITDKIEGHREYLQRNGIDLDGVVEYKSSRHTSAGQAILQKFGFSDQFSLIIGSHHGRSAVSDNQIDSYPENYYGRRSLQEEKWTGIWEEWIDYSLQSCGFEAVDDIPAPDVKIQMLITALLIMSDWIASNSEYFPLAGVFEHPEETVRIKSAWNSLGMSEHWYAENNVDVEEMFIRDFGFPPLPFQRDIMDITSTASTPGIYIIEAPMGLGKTEAALAASEILAGKFGCGGLYFGLPTQATANGIFGRIRSWADLQYDGEKHSIRLAHGATSLNDEYVHIFHGSANDISDEDGLFVHQWFEGRKRALLADFVIATVDQFLMASLKQKHVMLRHLGLAGKVVIIDECHAYDAYMSVYLDKTLTWMGAYKIPTIILSATLPPERKTQLIKAYLNVRKDIIIPHNNAYPILTWTDEGEVYNKPLKSEGNGKTIKVIHFSEDELFERLADKLKNGGCASVIVNTVSKAQMISRQLASCLNGFEVVCFHSRFTMTDRADIENSLMERIGKNSVPESRNKLIVVGTQVIEQSLDIDFDFMVTELCPMDLLLQRAGRLHRHKRVRPQGLEESVLAVMHTDMNASEHIYTKWLLAQTKRYLPDAFDIPSCIPELIGKVYSKPENNDDADWREYNRLIRNKEEKAKKFCIASHLINDDEVNLDEILDDSVGNDMNAEMSVRDGEESIEVLLLQKSDDNKFKFLPWRNNGMELDTTAEPTIEEANAIEKERVKLPVRFQRFGNYDKTLRELTEVPIRWRNCGVLKGELILLLDKDNCSDISGVKLIYSKEYGLEEIKEG